MVLPRVISIELEQERLVPMADAFLTLAMEE